MVHLNKFGYERINWHEFINRLDVLGALPFISRHSEKPKIAIGVSGGADSMVLAYLLHNVEHPLFRGRRLFDVHGFIVDHGVRAESRDEAHLVQQNLNSLGIMSQILNIQWPHDIDCKSIKGFEERARTARYELIATSALRSGCKSLFTGHHLDDDIETLLFRLMRDKQHSLHSLCGIQGKALIPCEQVFGTHGYSAPLRQSSSRRRSGITEQPLYGISLYRPLLSFPKSRILATCSDLSIAYVDDKTNHDPMFATRNAIRYLRKSDLPRALQSPRLLQLQERASIYFKGVEGQARDFIPKISKLDLYGETGTCEVVVHIAADAVDSAGWRYLMARIVELVAPLSNASFPTCLSVRKSLETLQIEMGQTEDTKRVALARTMIRIEQMPALDGICRRFVLQRQPFRQGEVKETQLYFEPDTSPPEVPCSKAISSKYVLWDGRFWVRIFCGDCNVLSKISVRAFRSEDIQCLRKALKSQGLDKKFDNRLSHLIPMEEKRQSSGQKETLKNSVRNTLPVLVYDDQLVAFPTLNFKVDTTLIRGLRWEVKYRRANRVLDFFASYFHQPPLTKARDTELNEVAENYSISFNANEDSLSDKTIRLKA